MSLKRPEIVNLTHCVICDAPKGVACKMGSREPAASTERGYHFGRNVSAERIVAGMSTPVGAGRSK